MIHDGTLVLTENLNLKEDLTVYGDIRCEGGIWSISAHSISAHNILVHDISGWDVSSHNILAHNILVDEISAHSILAHNISADDISYYAVCLAYESIKCKSIKGERENSKHFVLDGEITITGQEKDYPLHTKNKDVKGKGKTMSKMTCGNCMTSWNVPCNCYDSVTQE